MQACGGAGSLLRGPVGVGWDAQFWVTGPRVPAFLLPVGGRVAPDFLAEQQGRQPLGARPPELGPRVTFRTLAWSQPLTHPPGLVRKSVVSLGGGTGRVQCL